MPPLDDNDPRGDAAWTDPSEPPRWRYGDPGTPAVKHADNIWSVWLEDTDHPYIWHWCDRSIRNRVTSRFTTPPGWVLAGTGAHQLISREPLHLEPSLYWPECCGTHGFLRDGNWQAV